MENFCMPNHPPCPYPGGGVRVGQQTQWPPRQGACSSIGPHGWASWRNPVGVPGHSVLIHGGMFAWRAPGALLFY